MRRWFRRFYLYSAAMATLATGVSIAAWQFQQVPLAVAAGVLWLIMWFHHTLMRTVEQRIDLLSTIRTEEEKEVYDRVSDADHFFALFLFKNPYRLYRIAKRPPSRR